MLWSRWLRCAHELNVFQPLIHDLEAEIQGDEQMLEPLKAVLSGQR